jgi:hypothetical protein
LIVFGAARGHETGKQGNPSAKPGQEKLPIVRAIGSGRIDTEVCDVTAGARSPATDGAARPRSPEQLHRPPAARAARSAATFNPSRRSATITAAASSTASIAFGLA